MTPRAPKTGEHLLIYEPRIEGHHLSWLRFITEDFLSAGLRLTLAVDSRPEAEAKVREHLGELQSEVTLMSARRGSKNWWKAKAGGVAECLRESGAENVFLCAFDEIASDCWRRAAFGLYPPKMLQGRMGGIYHRGQFLSASKWSPKRLHKQLGFQKILGQGWLRQLIFLDEYLVEDLRTKYPGAPIHYLPMPCPEGLAGGNQNDARRQLGLPVDKRVMLFYGTGARRKGLHLAVEAMRELGRELPAFLLCAGQLNPEDETARTLGELVRQDRAKLINKYVSAEEEKLCFAAADVVLLPYLHHFGGSAVLSQAAAAGRMVIASDEELTGKLTRGHGLGLLFPTGDAAALRERMREATLMDASKQAAYTQAASAYAKSCSRDAYRQALINAVVSPKMPQHA
jgi:glycosyltransferase involved in cell wall biosynthesis